MVSLMAFQRFPTMERSTLPLSLEQMASHMVRVLAESLQRWETVYALSRKPPNTGVAPNVKNLAVNFLTSPNEIAKILKENNVKA